MGRPTSYKPEYCEQATKLCRLGATDESLADFFKVSVATIHNWKNSHPEFLDALKAGKELADAEVAQKLYSRATGYSHEAVKIVADAKSGTEHVVPYTEHYPPDTTAAIFWLKNRRPDLWRDRVESVNTTTHKHVVTDKPLTADEWERQYSDSVGAAAGTAKSTH